MESAAAEAVRPAPPMRRRGGLPKGPRGAEMLRIVRQLVRDPIPALEQLQRGWGDVVGVALPGYRTVFLFHPNDIEQVLVQHARSTGKGPSVRRGARVLGTNMFVLEGDEHTRRRRIASGVFRARDVAPLAPETVEDARDMAAAWNDGDTIEVGTHLGHMMISAIGHALFGGSLAADAPRILKLAHEVSDQIGTVISPAYPMLSALPLPSLRRIDATARAWDELILELMSRARSGDATGDSRNLSMLLAAAGDADQRPLTQDELVQELRGFVIAGYDTTTLALTWTLLLLARHPNVRERMVAELDAVVGAGPATVEHLSHLNFTRAVVDEALRMYGGAFCVRDALADIEVGGIRIRKGWEVFCGMWNAHHDPRWWGDPETFRPERFLVEDHDRPRFAYFPFGGGRRQCIGKHLALQSAMLVLAEIHRTWLLDPADDTDLVAPTCQVVVKPDRPVRLVVRGR